MTQLRLTTAALALTFLAALRPAWSAQWVNESARDIPVAYDVDVVIVGGGTGAVAAAVSAAETGASVFLAAPHPYLGDDMTATLQLWLEQGETPKTLLARQLFNDEQAESSDTNRLGFKYEADTPSAPIHKDTNPPSRLTDGKWSSAVSESVQYERDTNIIVDLGQTRAVRKARVVAYRRRGTGGTGGGFDVGSINVAMSADKRNWKHLGVMENDSPLSDIAVLTLPCEADARYVKLSVTIPAPYERMLLGEIEIIGPEREAAADAPPVPPRPMHVKKVLDNALLEAGAEYLYSCLATDVLRDDTGRPCGIVMANRAGRQAVRAKWIIDATSRAVVARMAGAAFRRSPRSTRRFRRVVIGGEPHLRAGVEARIAAGPFRSIYPNTAPGANGAYQVIEYTIPLEVNNDSYAAYMRADQQARTLTFDPLQQFTSDELFEIPPDRIAGREELNGPSQDVKKLPLGVFQPSNVERLFVLGGCADISREQAGELVRSLARIDLGGHLGRAAAVAAGAVSLAGTARLPGRCTSAPVAEGDVREFLRGVRPTGHGTTVRQDARSLPVLGIYDVVVIGGGTGGAPAGIGAARQGVKTLVVEYLYGLGGVGTEGAISSYYWGNRVGFTATILDGSIKWPIEPKKEWYRRQLLEAGAEIWFGTIGCGVFVQGNQVLGAVVATPYGRGVVLAKTVIDATGNSDVAAAAGAQCIYTNASEFGMQGAGLPGRRLGGSYNNTDFTIVDETDMVDIWHVFVYSKEKYPDAFDHGRLIDTRERRRIVGDCTISVMDEMNERTYPDSIERSWSNFDTHGYTIDPFFLLEHPEKKGIGVYIPFRALLPKGLEGILVTGLSISAHRDALPLIRMQADIQNGGYAAGVAAAMAAKAGVCVRHIEVRRLQEHLVEIGNLPDTVLRDTDSYPLSDEEIACAVENLKQGQGTATILADPQRAVPLLQAAFRAAAGSDRLVYAKALAILGCDQGVDLLIEAVQQARQWDQGWNYKGMGQFGAALSPLDVVVISLGRAGNAKAVPPLLEKVALLGARTDFSHHRAAGLALELLGDARAAKPLADLLAKPNMSGHVHRDVATAKARGASGGTSAERTRRESLRELMLARALFRCGDFQDVGRKILQDYSHDLRGHVARHAQAVLEKGND